MKLIFISLLLPFISEAEDEKVATSSSTEAHHIDIPLREYNVSFNKSPEVQGLVSAPDQSTLFIHDFSFNGTDRFAFFWAGENYGNNTLPDIFDGTTFLNPAGEPSSWTYEEIIKMDMKESLGAYETGNVTLHLPEGMKVSQLKFLAVWSPDMESKKMRDSINWGHVRFPDEGLRVMSGGGKVLFSSLLLLVASGLTIFM